MIPFDYQPRTRIVDNNEFVELVADTFSRNDRETLSHLDNGMSQRRVVDFTPDRVPPPRWNTRKLTGKARSRWVRTLPSS